MKKLHKKRPIKDIEKINQMKSLGKSVIEIAKELDTPKNTIWGRLRKERGENYALL